MIIVPSWQSLWQNTTGEKVASSRDLQKKSLALNYECSQMLIDTKED